MAIYYERADLAERLRKRTDSGQSLLMMGCGSGLSAISAEQGGADLISVYATAVLRMEGIPTVVSLLPYSDCNDITYRKAEIILPLVKETPCIAGVGAHAPFLDLDRHLERLRAIGFSGVVNEPFAAGYGPAFAENLERAGCGFSREIELIALAHEKDLFTAAWCSTPEEARRMAEAGADMIGVVLFGKFDGMDGAIQALKAVTEAARAVRSDVLVLAHGGPFHDPDTARAAVGSCYADGYACGSNGERVCAEEAIRANAARYRDLK